VDIDGCIKKEFSTVEGDPPKSNLLLSSPQLTLEFNKVPLFLPPLKWGIRFASQFLINLFLNKITESALFENAFKNNSDLKNKKIYA
jgi:hypothetical protein